MPEILDRRAFKTCHVHLPDTPEPVSAITYRGEFYSFVRVYPQSDAAQRAVERLIERGNRVVLTQIRKGLVLWVFEPDAYLAQKNGRQ